MNILKAQHHGVNHAYKICYTNLMCVVSPAISASTAKLMIKAIRSENAHHG